jgi:hypothetical protein
VRGQQLPETGRGGLATMGSCQKAVLPAAVGVETGDLARSLMASGWVKPAPGTFSVVNIDETVLPAAVVV